MVQPLQLHLLSLLVLLALSAKTTVAVSANSTDRSQCLRYKAINGSLCISQEFTVSYLGISNEGVCGALCSGRDNCRAFSTANASCQLFVFDRCSKSVRNCGCTSRGRVFVKQQPGLEPGALCPAGYGSDQLCGVKYKMQLNTGFWWQSRWKCENESDLVITADVTSTAELNVVERMFQMYNISFWLGGYQTPNSTEPAGGWNWVPCNITLDGSLWATGQPDNANLRENVIGRYAPQPKLGDFWESSATPMGVLCECVSPFD